MRKRVGVMAMAAAGMLVDCGSEAAPGDDDVVAQSEDGLVTSSSCVSAACAVCRATFPTATDACTASYPLVHQLTGTARERFSYTGANEGHDGMANLMRGVGKPGANVCNVSRGSCTGSDSQCGSNLLASCYGELGSPDCHWWEECTGEWMRSGTTGWLPRTQRLFLTLAPDWTPVDCDCGPIPSPAYVMGQNKSRYMISVDASDVWAAPSFTGITQAVSDAGQLAHRGYAASFVHTYGI